MPPQAPLRRYGPTTAASLAAARAAAWLISCSCGARFADQLDGRITLVHFHARHRYTARPNPARPVELR